MEKPNSKMILYRIANKINGKRYIGITTRGLPMRKGQHLWDARNGKKTIIAAAIRKYGESSFEWSVLYTCSTRDELVKLEIETIGKLHPEYNISLGGERGAWGAVRSPELRKKLSDMMKAKIAANGNWWSGRKHSIESIEKMREASIGRNGYWRGKARSDDDKRKMRENRKAPTKYWLGKKRSPETIEKIKNTKAALPYKPPTEKAIIARRLNFQKCQESKLRKVRCIDDGYVYSSVTEAARKYGATKSNVVSVCRGRYKKTSGMRFEYVR